MTTLANFPMKNQRISVLSDGTRDPNDNFDCVAESIAAGMQYYTGLLFEGGILKEICYGRNYQGTTAAVSYVQYCAQHNVHLYPLQGDNGTLVQAIHQHIQAGHPVILTEIDPYCTAEERAQGWTHVVIAYSECPGSITVMDPFGGFPVTKSDTQWMQDMRFGEVWPMEPIQEDVPVSIGLNQAVVANYFVAAPGGAWHCKQTGYTIGGAILTFYRTLGNAGLCGLTHMGLPTSNERGLGIKDHPEIVEQDFERFTVRYDPNHIVDNPPGAGAVYIVHQKPAVDVTSYQKQVDQAHSLLIDMQHKFSAIETIIKS